MRTLIEFIVTHSQKPLPADCSRITNDSSFAYYLTKDGRARSAPTGLCYLVADQERENINAYQHRAIMPPHIRRQQIDNYIVRYLSNVRFGTDSIKIVPKPVRVPQRMFVMPDLKFGNERVLSVRGTPRSQHVSLDAVGRTRAMVLRDSTAGVYVRQPLERQYLLLPETVASSFGDRYVADLKQAVNEYLGTGTYEPIVVSYPDRVNRTFVDQGKAILEAAKQRCVEPGFALVMIHHTTDRRVRQQDQLAAMVVRRLRDELDLIAAVNHSAFATDSYRLGRGVDGLPAYFPIDAKRAR